MGKENNSLSSKEKQKFASSFFVFSQKVSADLSCDQVFISL